MTPAAEEERRLSAPAEPPVPPFVDPALARGYSSLDDFTGLEKIGAGCSAIVYAGVCTRTGDRVVVKVISRSENSRADATRQTHILRELRIHASASHEHIVGFRGAFECTAGVCIVQDFAGGGDLFNLLAKCGGRLSEQTVVTKIMIPLLRALVDLHARGIVHRDIKPENVRGELLISWFSLNFRLFFVYKPHRRLMTASHIVVSLEFRLK
jgi:hypothetical protein